MNRTFLPTTTVRGLWRQHAGRLGRFAVVGVANTLLDIGLFALLYYHLQLHLLLANSLSYSAGVGNSFVLNKFWTFQDKSGWTGSLPRLLLFVGCNLLGLGLTNLIIWSLAYLVPAIAAKCAAVTGVFAWNYWTSHRFVFVAAVRPQPGVGPLRPREGNHAGTP